MTAVMVASTVEPPRRRVRRIRVRTVPRATSRSVAVAVWVATRVNADRVSVATVVKQTSTTVLRMVMCCVQGHRVKTDAMATTVTVTARVDVGQTAVR